jgi:putative membrane protein
MPAIAAVGFGEVITPHLHLDTIGLILGLALFYELGIRRLAVDYAPRGEPVVTRRQRILFYSGLVLMGIVSTYPFHDIGEQSLYSFHMVEHLVIALITPPFVLAGMPWWLLRLVVKPIMPVMRILTRPLVALVAFNATLALIHVPRIVELMLTSDPFHFGAHALLLLTAFLMWWPVIGPLPELPRLAPFGKMGYLFLQSLVPTIPASFLTLASGAVYPIYETFPRLWDISVITDQTVAGLIMKLGGGAILWIGIGYVFFKWYEEEQKLTGPLRVVPGDPAKR